MPQAANNKILAFKLLHNNNNLNYNFLILSLDKI